MYFLSQVEYSEGEEITHTGVDEYERYEQEKKLKEYVSSGQVKDLIRLIQVFSVILDQGRRFAFPVFQKYRCHGRSEVLKERGHDAHDVIGACDSVHLDGSEKGLQRVDKDQYDWDGTDQQQLQELHFSSYHLPVRTRKGKKRVFHSFGV